MKELTFDQMLEMEGSEMECAKAVIIGSTLGSFFGGVGAVVGAAVATAGPECLGWW